ncbi:fibronectin type III-like domain-contianing protein [Streptomyces sp. NBC_00401]|uniref:fibronectin type III-like domain-contianing protein n=1 Tax=Streptomyces sp. NBC_00401 TaxID=2975738 RepID=UPI0022589E78|nr:fibronectin type III-like domain-contianing protein [Streptomyces sp. NBC_00401]MCX5085680.1 fibronectin type III-like domain-contianing protein [Streptomyces sp. NBC_00401]
MVQLYVRDEDASVRPVRQLLDFARVRLAPGETRPVSFSVPLARLDYTLPDGSRGFEASVGDGVGTLLAQQRGKEQGVGVPKRCAFTSGRTPRHREWPQDFTLVRGGVSGARRDALDGA